MQPRAAQGRPPAPRTGPDAAAAGKCSAQSAHRVQRHKGCSGMKWTLSALFYFRKRKCVSAGSRLGGQAGTPSQFVGAGWRHCPPRSREGRVLPEKQRGKNSSHLEKVILFSFATLRSTERRQWQYAGACTRQGDRSYLAECKCEGRGCRWHGGWHGRWPRGVGKHAACEARVAPRRTRRQNPSLPS